MLLSMMEKFIPVQWPLGPDLQTWTDASIGSPTAWPRYKLRSADWFTAVLNEIGDEHGFARLVGVEMALDGALSALSGAFDAGVAGLILSCEERLKVHALCSGLPIPRPAPPHEYKWDLAKMYLKDERVTGSDQHVLESCQLLIQTVDGALARTPPLGWLETLRRLRNGATHRDSLARHMEVMISDGGTAEVSRTDVLITVDDSGVNPVVYLRSSRQKITNLLEQHVLHVAELLAPGGKATSPRLH